MRILGYLVALAIVWLLVGQPGNVADAGAILAVLAFMLAGFIGAAGTGAGRALSGIFAPGTATPDTRALAFSTLRAMRLATLGGGLFCAVAGAILLFKDGFQMAAPGPGLALGLVGLFWAAVVAYVLLLPLQAGVAPHLQDDAAARPSELSLDLALAGLGTVVVIVTSVVLRFVAHAAG